MVHLLGITIFETSATCAIFQEEGNVKKPREELTTDVIAGRVDAIQSFKIKIGLWCPQFKILFVRRFYCDASFFKISLLIVYKLTVIKDKPDNR